MPWRERGLERKVAKFSEGLVLGSGPFLSKRWALPMAERVRAGDGKQRVFVGKSPSAMESKLSHDSPSQRPGDVNRDRIDQETATAGRAEGSVAVLGPQEPSFSRQ